jgi:hypothetical protein
VFVKNINAMTGKYIIVLFTETIAQYCKYLGIVKIGLNNMKHLPTMALLLLCLSGCNNTRTEKEICAGDWTMLSDSQRAKCANENLVGAIKHDTIIVHDTLWGVQKPLPEKVNEDTI